MNITLIKSNSEEEVKKLTSKIINFKLEEAAELIDGGYTAIVSYKTLDSVKNIFNVDELKKITFDKQYRLLKISNVNGSNLERKD